MFVLTGSDNLLNKTLLYDYAESIAGGCEPGQVGLIVRRSYQSDPEFVFGFYRYLKPEFLKRVCFKYVNHISDLVALLYLHSTQTQCSGLGFLFIENLEDFFDGPITEKASTELVVLFNLLYKLQKKFPTHPDVQFGRLGTTITYKEGSNNFVKNNLPELVRRFNGSSYLLGMENEQHQLIKNGSVYASRYTSGLFQSLERYRQSLAE